MVLNARHTSKKIGFCTLIIIALFIVLVACDSDKEPPYSSETEQIPAELSAKVDKVTADPGDIITLTLMANYRSDVSLVLPEIADRLSEFRIVNSSVSQPTQKGDRYVVERLYKLQADISGSYIIEPVEATYTLPSGEQGTVKTPKIFIEIKSLLGKEGEAEDIRDIKPPVPVSHPYRLFLLILAILAGAILVLLFTRKLIDRLKHKAQLQATTLRHAHEEALEALEKLLNKRLVEKGRMRKFCFEISAIFRRYMQAQFGFPAIDLTMEEIIWRIEDNGIIEENLRPLVKEFLMDTDLVKFAKYQPTFDEMQKILQYTRTFIDRTKVDTTVAAEVAKDGETG